MARTSSLSRASRTERIASWASRPWGLPSAILPPFSSNRPDSKSWFDSHSNRMPNFLTPTNAQSWDYDAVGNWDSVTTNSTTQTRGANRQNEITSVSGAITPTYDNNGNLTRDENDNRFVWDAWNREVKIRNSSNTVIATNAYDALNHKVQVNTSAGLIDKIFGKNEWQVFEDKNGSNTLNRYGWSPAYVDGLVNRDRDTDGNGNLDERLFALQDANWNVTGITNTSGTVQERYTETPFGVVTFRDSSGSPISVSTKDWDILHQGAKIDVIGDFDFRNRVYTPTLGRWLSNDPIGFNAGDVNTYRTEINSPVNQVDPEGLVLPLFGWGIVALMLEEGGVFGYGIWLEHEPKKLSDGLDEKLRKIHLAHPEKRTNGRAPGADNPNGSSVRNLGNEFIPGYEPYLQTTFRDANRLMGIGERGYLAAIPTFGIRHGSNIRPPTNISAPNSKLPRFEGPKPSYSVNPVHAPGTIRQGKAPLPADAEAVFRRAVPDDPVNPRNWFGQNAKGQIYRFSGGNDGTAHFSGIEGIGDGIRNITNYAQQRLAGLKE